MPLLAIVGPTATGKTEISVQVAKRLGAEIISADSMLIYRHMDIGTAKPTPEEMEGVPHHMIDVADPDDTFNVALYNQAVKDILPGILKRNKLPMLVGGTGLYVKAVIEDYNFTQAETNHELREKLMRECATWGKPALHRRLAEIDPETASRLHVNDVKRVIRALEVYYQTGKTLSESARREKKPVYNLLMYGLTMDRQQLYSRIEKRVDKMIASGLIDEVEELLARGYSPGLTSMQGLGYKEIARYLNKELTLDQAVILLKQSTRRFAKRQLTWFGRDKRIKWIDVGNKSVEEVTSEIASVAAGVFQTASKTK